MKWAVIMPFLISIISLNLSVDQVWKTPMFFLIKQKHGHWIRVLPIQITDDRYQDNYELANLYVIGAEHVNNR